MSSQPTKDPSMGINIGDTIPKQEAAAGGENNNRRRGGKNNNRNGNEPPSNNRTTKFSRSTLDMNGHVFQTFNESNNKRIFFKNMRRTRKIHK